MKPVVGATVKQPWCEAKVVLIVVRGHVVKTCVPGLGGPVAGLNPKTVLCSGELAGGKSGCFMHTGLWKASPVQSLRT